MKVNINASNNVKKNKEEVSLQKNPNLKTQTQRGEPS
jgi:hypothetical protein